MGQGGGGGREEEEGGGKEEGEEEDLVMGMGRGWGEPAVEGSGSTDFLEDWGKRTRMRKDVEKGKSSGLILIIVCKEFETISNFSKQIRTIQK